MTTSRALPILLLCLSQVSPLAASNPVPTAAPACVDGDTAACTIAGCLKAERECVNGVIGPCLCVIQTCDDANPCTADSFDGTGCVHAPRTSAACDDGNSCTLGDVCTSLGACAGTPVTNLDDGLACTYDYCDGTGVHHDVIASCPAPAPAAEEAYSAPPTPPNPLGHPIPTMPGTGGPIVDRSTGVATMTYPIDLPRARGRYQPALVLGYSSGSLVDEGLGVGWSIGLSYIENDPSTPPVAGGFWPSRLWVSLNGARSLLLLVSSGANQRVFRTATQGRLVDLVETTSGTGEVTWAASDLEGTRYEFTQRAGVRSYPDRVYLTKVTDVDGNETVFTHQYDAASFSWGVLRTIQYNAYGPSGTRHYATTVDLTWAGGGSRRYGRFGASVVPPTSALSSVSIKNKSAADPATDTVLVRHELRYEPSPKGNSSLLRSITLFGGSGSRSLPPTLFTYGDEGGSYTLAAGRSFALSDRTDPTMVDGEWIDLDGDGLPDRVAGFKWQRNVTARGSGAPAFAPVQTIPGTGGLVGTFRGDAVHARFMDANGDGVADLLRTSGGICPFEVRLGSVSSGAYSVGATASCVDVGDASRVGSVAFGCLAASVTLSLMTTDPSKDLVQYVKDPTGALVPVVYAKAPGVGVLLSLRDVNGDGILDYVLRRRDDSTSVYLGFGVVGSGPAGFGPEEYLDAAEGASGLDLNGDGLAGDYTYTTSAAGVTYRHVCFNAGTTSPACWNRTWVLEPAKRLSVPDGTFWCPDHDLSGSAFTSYGEYDDPRQTVDYVDLNGDGLPERISKEVVSNCGAPFTGPLGATCMDPTEPTPWNVEWNTGEGFVLQAATLRPQRTGSTAGLANAFPGVVYRADGGRLTCRYARGGDPLLGTSAFKGWSASFVDLDGDGVVDWVTNQTEVLSDDGNWMLFPGAVEPLRLSTVRTSAGATFTVQYAPSYQFGAGPLDGSSRVVTRLSVSGPGIPPAATSYAYAGPVHGASALDPQRQTSRGFGTTWSWLEQPGAASAVAERMTWATGSSVLAGSPTKVEWGTFTGAAPSDANFSPFRRVDLAYELRPGGGGTCLAAGAEPPVSAYPGLIPVITNEVTTNILDAVPLATSRTRSCPADVDQFGNILRTAFDQDTSSTLDQQIEERASFEASATCKTCPTQVSVTALGSGTKLAESQYVYDSVVGTWNQPGAGGVRTGHLNYVRRWVSTEGGYSRYDVDSATAYNANGTVAYRVMDPYPMSHAVTTREYYVYDQQALRVTQTVTTSGTNTNCSDLAAGALCKEVDYDPATGRPVREYGLYRSGTRVTNPPPKVEIAYDDFGRAVAVGRTAARDAITGNITLTGAISATEYVDSSPPVTKSYAFQAPLSLTLTAGAVPVRPDIRQVITYRDALGRTTEVKERLGAPGTADASSQIVQNLTGYRVASHVQYDLAGRPVGVLEPYLSAAETQDSFDTQGAAFAQRGAWTTYDERGRVTCVKAGVFTASKTGTCASTLTDSVNHTLATRFAFSALAGATGVRPVAIGKAFGPSSTGSVATEARYTSDGLLASTADHDGNTSSVKYDALLRVTETSRQAKGVPGSLQRTTRKLDALGRVLEEWDDDWSPGTNPSRLYSYDAMGRAYEIQLPPQLVGPSKVRPLILRQYKSLGRLTLVEAREPTWQAGAATWGARTIAAFAYDSPHTGNATSYPNTPGQVASITSPLTTIAFGYDQNGQATRRDQWIGKLVGAFSLTGTVTDDGRVTSSRLASPSSYGKEVAYFGRFDSAGRPVQVGLGGTATAPVTVAWEARNAADTSNDAYDAVGRVRLVKSNGGTVKTFRNYASYTGNLTSQAATLNATTGVYGIDNVLYLGTKLTGYRDTTVSGTTSTYANKYDANGRLISAVATKAGTGTLPQAYDQSYSFTDPSWPTGASVGNLEQVRSGGATTSYGYIQDRAVQQTGAEAFTYEYDLAGRLTAKKSGAAEQEGFVYDVQDQLKQVRRGGTLSEVIEYDPAGLPLFRKLGTAATWYVGPSATVTGTVPSMCLGAADCTPTAGTVRVAVHVLAGGSRVASVKAQAGTNTAPDPISEVLYYHRDLQGSVVATTLRAAGVNGRMGVRYRYQPYGQLDRTDTSSLGAGVTWAMADSELGYTGGLRLGHAPGVAQQGTLLLLGARVYHSGLKRWLQADTVDVLRGTYVDGDPVNLVDPSGREAESGHRTPVPGIYIDGFYFPDASWARFYLESMYGEDASRFTGGMNINLFVGMLRVDAQADKSRRRREEVSRVEANQARINSAPPVELDGRIPVTLREAAQINGWVVDSSGRPVVLAMDVYIQVEGDLVGIVGLEGGVGIVIDTDRPLESGVFWTGGGAAGANVGVSLSVGFAMRDVEGWSTSVDWNAGALSPVASFDDFGFNGLSLGVGPGKGLSVSQTKTSTRTLLDTLYWMLGISSPR